MFLITAARAAQQVAASDAGEPSTATTIPRSFVPADILDISATLDGRHQRRVDANRADRGGTTRRAERRIPAGQDVVEEGGVVRNVLSLVVGNVAFPVDRPYPANQF